MPTQMDEDELREFAKEIAKQFVTASNNGTALRVQATKHDKKVIFSGLALQGILVLLAVVAVFVRTENRFATTEANQATIVRELTELRTDFKPLVERVIVNTQNLKFLQESERGSRPSSQQSTIPRR